MQAAHLSDVDVAASVADADIRMVAHQFSSMTYHSAFHQDTVESDSLEEESDSEVSDDEERPETPPAMIALHDEKLETLLEEGEEETEEGEIRSVQEPATEEVTRIEPIRSKNELPSAPMKTAPDFPEGGTLTAFGTILSVNFHEGQVTICSSQQQQPQTQRRQGLLDEDTMVCLSDRTVLGCVDEVFGPVSMPMYTIRFDPKVLTVDKLVPQTTAVYYVNECVSYLKPENISQSKGSDASNIHDEEPEAEELEFSDDEAEAAYKKAKKQAKRKTLAPAEEPTKPHAHRRGGHHHHPPRPHQSSSSFSSRPAEYANPNSTYHHRPRQPPQHGYHQPEYYHHRLPPPPHHHSHSAYPPHQPGYGYGRPDHFPEHPPAYHPQHQRGPERPPYPRQQNQCPEFSAPPYHHQHPHPPVGYPNYSGQQPQYPPHSHAYHPSHPHHHHHPY